MKKSLGILNAFTLLGTLTINGLSNGTLISEKTVGQISDTYPTLFAPAGFTFSIWGIIYLGLLGFAIFQARDLFSPRPLNLDFRDKIGPWFVLSNLFNMAWIIAWLNEYPGLALLLMLGLLISLLAIYIRLEIGAKKAIHPVKWFVHVPFSIYLGWICVAIIANASAFLVSIQWPALGLPDEAWTVAMILVAGILGSVLGYLRKDLALRLVFLWALFGIYSKIKGLDIEEGKYLIWTLAASGGLILLSMLGNLIWNRNPKAEGFSTPN